VASTSASSTSRTPSRRSAHLAAAGDRTDNALLHDALLFQFVVIGEAVKHLEPETRDDMPAIPWQNIAGLRDRITHEYFTIDMQRVLDIVERDLPALERAIDQRLNE
jgi:uncharacterized protein with HEPN domain